MTTKTEPSIQMVWIVVDDLKKAVKFYTETVGLTVSSITEEYGWAELSGGNGCMLGLAQKSKEMDMQPGENAVLTFTVGDVAAETQRFRKKGANIEGEMMEVPNHVKLQSVRDPDGNLFQLVECLDR
jgi:predicted enzyme related to lactoylglutathione lyase